MDKAPTPKPPKTDKLDIVTGYFTKGYRVLFWKDEGAVKGPNDKAWQNRVYALEEYKPDYHRVGLLTGVEVSPGKFLHDVDIDWGEGHRVALKILSNTGFVFGRHTKHISHCLYTTPEPIPTFKYEDVDGTALIEIRGTKKDGTLGHQSMVPPSVWEDKVDHHREPLILRRDDDPAHLDTGKLRQEVGLAAIAMILAKHFGVHGFGHDPRLAWAGFFLRLGFTTEEIITMGEAISVYCQNTEVSDVRLVVETTAKRLADPKQRIKGGPTLAKFLGDQGKKVIARIREWLGRDSDFERNKEGVIVRDSLANVKRAVETLNVTLSYNEFADKLLIDGHALEDRQLTDLWFKLDQEFHFKPTETFFDRAIRHIAWENAFHPVKQYLDPLVWDGTPRIDTWLKDFAGAEDSPYLRAVSSMVLIAAVKRIRQPGCKFDEMLVLESDQGMNKSSALRALCPNPAWFSDDLPLNLKSQQMIESTLGKWILEAADLAGKRKAEVEQLKAMLSRQVDGPARMAYARLPVERPRQFVIIGTTNSGAYLTDPTGARRFWPVKITTFDVAAIIANRDQIWAEAAHREAAGESIRLKESLWKDAGEIQEQRREVDAWEDILVGVLTDAPVGTTGKKVIPTTTLWESLGIEVARRDRNGAIRISEIMHRYGFTRVKVWHEGKTVVGYEGPAVKLNLESNHEGVNGQVHDHGIPPN